MANEVLQIGQHRIEIVRNARRRRIALEITGAGIKLRSPLRSALKTLLAFAKSKEHWLDRHAQSLPAPLPPIEPFNGMTLRVFADTVRLHYDFTRAGQATLDYAHRRLIVPVGRNANPQLAAKRKLRTCLMALATEHIAQRSADWAQEMNLKPRSIVAKDYKRRWGSCDRRANLSFNWRLMFAPTAVIDYVIVHELAHIRVFNHSPAFWRLVTTHYPRHTEAKAWLNTHSAELYRLQFN